MCLNLILPDAQCCLHIHVVNEECSFVMYLSVVFVCRFINNKQFHEVNYCSTAFLKWQICKGNDDCNTVLRRFFCPHEPCTIMYNILYKLNDIHVYTYNILRCMSIEAYY